MKMARLLLPLAVTALLATGCGHDTAPTSAAASHAGSATSTTQPAPSATSQPGTTNDPQAGPAAAEVAAARMLLAQTQVGGRGAKTGYDRTGKFGTAWVDVDANGCGTRDDVLSRDLTGVGKRDRCVVVSGTLHDPYTGRDITFSKANATAVQIDHVVPLSLAWQLGAAQWPQGERVAFANDPANLLAADGPSNEQKSDSGPDAWLPANKSYRCTYVIRFIRMVNAYKLRVTPSMHDTISGQLDSCTTVVGDPANLQTLPSSVWDRAAHLGGTSTSSGGAAPEAPPAATSGPPDGSPVYYANCAAVRAAGKAPLNRGDPGYRAGLDGNNDGIACSS